MKIKKNEVFVKKDAGIFASSKKVPTFASAFKKNGVLIKFDNSSQEFRKNKTERSVFKKMQSS